MDIGGAAADDMTAAVNNLNNAGAAASWRSMTMVQAGRTLKTTTCLALVLFVFVVVSAGVSVGLNFPACARPSTGSASTGPVVLDGPKRMLMLTRAIHDRNAHGFIINSRVQTPEMLLRRYFDVQGDGSAFDSGAIEYGSVHWSDDEDLEDLRRARNQPRPKPWQKAVFGGCMCACIGMVVGSYLYMHPP